jgi:hypothetical protein
MSRYSRYETNQKEKPIKQEIHPIWRGIGCILIVVNPVISYVAADFFVTNRLIYSWLIIPEEMIVKSLPDPLLLVKIFYTAIFCIILYLVLTVITFVINKIFGKSKYGPFDIPLDKVQRK